MCGISAVIALSEVPPTALQESKYSNELRVALNKSLDAIKHRGPNDRGQWLSENKRVSLGHVRLSIRDLSSAGQQPFCDHKHGVYIVVNGEIYGLEELMMELDADYKFSSQCDSEIVIPLYLKYGNYFLTKLKGEFSLVLYDSRSHILLAARDRFGVKPLFWTIVEGRLLVASEAKAFLPLGLKAEWDVPSILEDAWFHDERTLFKGVRKLRPGHYLTCSAFEYIQTRPYWEMEYPDKRMVEARTEEDMISGLRQHLLRAVQIRLESDRPVGIYLSGGIDSSILAGMAATLYGKADTKLSRSDKQKGPMCFTVGFEGRAFDESEVAQRTADFLGLDLKVQAMNEELLAANFADATWHAEHHNPDLNFVGKYLISALSHHHGYNVVLTGNGGDEHFGGYDHYRPDFIREPDLSWAQSSRMTDTERAELTAREEERCELGYTGTDRSFAMEDHERPRRMLNGTCIASLFWPVTMACFAPWTKCYGNLSLPQARANGLDVRTLHLVNKNWHPLHTVQSLEVRSIFPNLDLTCMGDRMEMSHSVEGRVPYLDHELTAYANNLPPSLKIKATKEGTFIEKWILREAGRPYVTEEVYRRSKHVFSAPVRYRKDGPIHQLFKALLTREKINNLGFLEIDEVELLMNRAFGDKGDANALRFVIDAAQWVVLSERFNVKKAEPLI